MSWSGELASVAFLEGRTHAHDGLQRRAVEIVLDERARLDERERKTVRSLLRSGAVSRFQLERAFR